MTAQRREQSLQSIPIAVSLLDGATIENSNADDLVALAAAVPGLTATNYSSANPQYFIRGIGSTASDAGNDSSVAVLIDEIYRGRAGATSVDLLDLQRIEVLRGPQGTLYGRNATGGVIHLVSNKPMAEPSAVLTAGTGSYDRRLAQMLLNGPLTARGDGEGPLARLAVSYQRHDGYVTNLTTGNSGLREAEDISGRIHLLAPLHGGELLLSADYFASDETGARSRKASLSQSPALVAGFIPVMTASEDSFRTTLASDGPAERDFWGVSARYSRTIASGEWVSLSAWRSNDYQVYEDVSGIGLILLGQDEAAKQFTQELRWSATTGGVQLIAGLYYLYETVDRVDVTDLSPITDFASLALPFTLPPARAYYRQDAHTESYAVFADARAPLTTALALTFGGRYTVDNKRMRLAATGSDPLGLGLLDSGPFSGRADERFGRFTGRLALEYSIDENHFSYLSYAEGYKAGGFDGNASALASFQQPFDEELAATVELGWKSQWWGDRLRFNGALFYTDYDDLQVFQVKQSGAQFVSNAARARLHGLELEASAHLSAGLQLQVAYSYLDAEYRDFLSAVDDNGDGRPDDLSGNQLTRAPAHSFFASLRYQWRLRDALPLSLRLDYSYQDELYITPQNRPLDRIDSYGLVHASLEAEFSQRWTLKLFGRNLTDERYALHAYDVDPFNRGLVQSSIYADPRVWGLELSYRR